MWNVRELLFRSGGFGDGGHAGEVRALPIETGGGLGGLFRGLLGVDGSEPPLEGESAQGLAARLVSGLQGRVSGLLGRFRRRA